MQHDFLSLKDKKAVITGGLGYLGRDIVKLFAQQGADIVSIDIIDEEYANKQLNEIASIGRNAYYFKCDITDAEKVEKVMKLAAQNLGGIDILINCAASARLFLAEYMPNDEWDKTIKVSLYGSFYCCKGAFDYLKAKGGSVVNISSIAALIGLPRGTVHHSAAKAGMLGMTRTLAIEWAKYKIRVNAIVPGQFDTALLREVMSNAEYAKDILRNIPLGRVGTIMEIALPTLFLASDAASFITGQTLVVDGGTTVF